MKKIISNSAFGIVEALIAIGIGSIVAVGIASMITNAMKQQKGIQAKDQQREVTAEIRTLFNNKAACLNSFIGRNPETGFPVTEIRDGAAAPGNVKYTVGANEKTGMLTFTGFRVANWAADPAPSLDGNADFIVNLSKVGETGTTREIKPDVIRLRIKRDLLGNIFECFSVGSQSDSLWQISPANLNDIYYSAGRVGVGVTPTTETFTVAGSSKFSGGTFDVTGTSSFIGNFAVSGPAFTYVGGGDFGFATTTPSDNGARVFSWGGDLYLQGAPTQAIFFRLGNAISMSIQPNQRLVVNNNSVEALGFATRAGFGGPLSGNNFNINWSGGAAQLWIDTTNVGNISLASDRRLKHHIEDYKLSGLAKIMNLRPVTYRWQNKDIFTDNGSVHNGFIADELQVVIPSAATYSKNALDEKGKPQYQSIVVLELLPVIVKAIQEIENKINEFITSIFDMTEKNKLLEQKILIQDQKIQKLADQNKQIKQAICEIRPSLLICTN